MLIKEKHFTIYITTDGLKFKDYNKAVEHQTFLNLQKWFLKRKMLNAEDTDKVIFEIIKDMKEFKKSILLEGTVSSDPTIIPMEEWLI